MAGSMGIAGPEGKVVKAGVFVGAIRHLGVVKLATAVVVVNRDGGDGGDGSDCVAVAV